MGMIKTLIKIAAAPVYVPYKITEVIGNAAIHEVKQQLRYSEESRTRNMIRHKQQRSPGMFETQDKSAVDEVSTLAPAAHAPWWKFWRRKRR